MPRSSPDVADCNAQVLEHRMKSNTRTAVTILALALAIAATSGCSWFGRDKRPEYEGSQEARPLEVPPDLDAPSTTSALTIPDAGNGTGSAYASGAPSESAPVPSIPPPPVAGRDATLRVTDGVPGTWRRVGLALERSNVGEVTARDEAGGTFTLTGTSTVTTRQGSWFKRLIGPNEKTTTEAVTRVVRVIADGSGSEIRVESEDGTQTDDEFSRRVIAALKQRLG
jgi:uncharacterized lipoprotein